MTGAFKANNPYNNFLLFAYGLILKLPLFINARIPHSQQSDGFLYKALLGWMQPLNHSFSIVYSLAAFGLLYIQAIGFNKLVNDQRLLPKPNYLTGMSYLLITSLFTDWYVLSAPLIVNTFLIWILAKLCNLYSDPNAKTTLFNIGMITGIATFFYFPSIVFFILLIAGLAITRSFRLPEWLIAFIGILTPYYFLVAWIFLAGRWKGFHFPQLVVTLPEFHETAWGYAAIIIILVTMVIGSSFIRNNMRRLLVQSRKSWSLVYLYLLVAVLIPFLNTVHDFDWVLAVVPVSALMAAAFLFPEKKWFATFIHWSLVALSVVIGYFIK